MGPPGLVESHLVSEGNCSHRDLYAEYFRGLSLWSLWEPEDPSECSWGESVTENHGSSVWSDSWRGIGGSRKTFPVALCLCYGWFWGLLCSECRLLGTPGFLLGDSPRVPPMLPCQTHLVQYGDTWGLGQLSLQQGVWVDSSWFHIGDVARKQVGQADTRGTIACRDREVRATQPGWLLLHAVKRSPSPYSVTDATCYR